MASIKRSRLIVIVGITLLLGACVPQGRPLIADRSPDFSDPNPSGVGQQETTSTTSQRQAPDQAPTPARARRSEQSATRIQTPRPKPATVPRKRAKLTAPAQYLVRRGDSLYAIAWRFELTAQTLARLNSLKPPYVIHPGQVLNLRAPKPIVAQTQRPRRQPTPERQSNPAKPEPQRPAAARAEETVKPAPSSGWRWPLSQSPSRGFGRSNKGVDFEIKERRTSVRAANEGQVVYAGNGIGGFEQLVIVRHSGDLLSAYSFNGNTLIKEQQDVKAGQKLADISNIRRGSQKLHFELRKHGKPIDPSSIIR